MGLGRVKGKARRPKSTGGYVDFDSYSKATPRPKENVPAPQKHKIPKEGDKR